MENKSLEELEQERIILKLRLLRLDKEIAKRKVVSKRELNLTDRSGIQICIDDKVKLLTKSANSSPFSDIKEAVVLGTAHNGKRVKIGLISDPSICTDRVPTNLRVIRDDDEKEISSGEETRRVSNQETN